MGLEIFIHALARRTTTSTPTEEQSSVLWDDNDIILWDESSSILWDDAGVWILETGVWNDDGVWDDNATWKDS